MIIYKTFKIDPYSCKVTFVITDNIEGYSKSLFKRLGHEYKVENSDCAYVLYSDINHYYLVFDKQYLDYNTISHEIYHLGMGITKPRDINDEESNAWLIGNLSSVFYKFLDKKKLQVTHG